MTEHNRNANDPNKGMNVKVFLISVVAAGCIIAIALFIFLKASGTKDIPKAADPNPHPTSYLVRPNSSRPTHLAQAA